MDKYSEAEQKKGHFVQLKNIFIEMVHGYTGQLFSLHDSLMSTGKHHKQQKNELIFLFSKPLYRTFIFFPL